jgi:hypothetical protein
MRTSYEGALSLVLFSVCHAFVQPRRLHRVPSPRDLFPSSQWIADDVGMDQAFNDSIVSFDGPVRNMVIGFGVIVLILAGLKVLTGQMDDAIQNVLVEFEATMKRSYPQRWQVITEELIGLEGDERDVKLLNLMETLQEKDPDFMARVKEKMSEK